MGSHFFLPSLHPFPNFFLSNIVSRILVTFLNQMTLLVRALNPNSFSMNLFHLSPPCNNFLQKGINVLEKDVLYNWTDMSSLSMSKTRKPFRASREFHPLTFHVFIEVCSRVRSFIVDLSTSTSLFPPLS